MDNIGVLMTCPMPSYLEHKLQTQFANLNLIKLWHFPPHSLPTINSSTTVKAIITDARTGTTADLIDALPNLEIVCTYSVGFDSIDLAKCRERGIRVTNTPDVLTDDVADLAVGLILAVLRKICTSDGFLRNGVWKSRDFELATKFSGKSVGIVGLGRIGSAVAKRAEAFGCQISYFSRSMKPNKAYKYCSDIIDLATNCDILVVACALTEETRHIINRAVLDTLSSKGILINIARGAHVDERELVSALLEGRLGGAGLDVFENEPEVPEELFTLENVVIQSHTGSDTVETCQAMADLLIQNLEAHFLNKPLITPVI